MYKKRNYQANKNYNNRHHNNNRNFVPSASALQEYEAVSAGSADKIIDMIDIINNHVLFFWIIVVK